MTEIVFDEDSLVLTASGHAGGGSYGNDIICAAVSILICTLAADAELMLGSGEGENRNRITLSSGAAMIDCSGLKSDRRARAMFENLCTGFHLLSLRYPENVSYRRVGGAASANNGENC